MKNNLRSAIGISLLLVALALYGLSLVPKQDKPESLESLGSAYESAMAKGDDVLARQALDKALLIDKNNTRLHRLRGRLKAKHGDRQGALTDYNQALASGPDADTLTDRAMLYFDEHSYNLAYGDYDALCSMKGPQALDGLFGKAFCNYSQGNQVIARKLASELLAKSPRYIKGYVLLGNSYAQSGELDSAVDVYTQGLRLEKNSADLHFDRGLVYSRQRQHALALKDYQAALAVKPQNSEYLVRAAYAAYDSGDKSLASKLVASAIAVDSKNKDALKLLGVLGK